MLFTLQRGVDVVGRWIWEMEDGIVRTGVRSRGQSFKFPNFNFSSSFS